MGQMTTPAPGGMMSVQASIQSGTMAGAPMIPSPSPVAHQMQEGEMMVMGGMPAPPLYQQQGMQGMGQQIPQQPYMQQQQQIPQQPYMQQQQQQQLPQQQYMQQQQQPPQQYMQQAPPQESAPQTMPGGAPPSPKGNPFDMYE
jgi:hypothetical protein